MSLEKLIKSYASYNKWANSTLAHYLKTLPEIILAREVPSGFSSIQKTIEHITYAEKFWTKVISNSDRGFISGAGTGSRSADFFDFFIDTSDMLSRFTNGLSGSQLEMKIMTPWITEPMPVYDVVQHCLGHSSYHRGQLSTIFCQIGLTNIPTVGYYEFLMEKYK